MRPRTTVGRRAVRVLLLLGGFLALAFVMGGQAHADSPDVPSVRSSNVSTEPTAAPSTSTDGTSFDGTSFDGASHSTAVECAAQGAASGAVGGARQADQHVADTVAQAAEAVPPLQPVAGVLGRVRQAARQVAYPVVSTVDNGLGRPAQPSTSSYAAVIHTAAWPHAAARTASAVRTGAPIAMAHGATGRVSPAAHGYQQQAPAQSPEPAGHSDHPCEGDGASHHTGDAHAALFAGGARFHLSAGAMRTAHGPAPLQRPAAISVQPD